MKTFLINSNWRKIEAPSLKTIKIENSVNHNQ
jgi:hypothetical protein